MNPLGQAEKINVFYRSESIPANISYFRKIGYSLIEKPKVVFESLNRSGMKFMPQSYAPLSWDDFKLCHSHRYVDALMTGEPVELAESCAIPWSREFADSLLYSGAALPAALDAAIGSNLPVMSLSFGMHHAGYYQGGSFCPFNDLVLSGMKAYAKHHLRGLVLDCDFHYGDGTDELIGKLDLDSNLHNLSLGKFQLSISTSKEYFQQLEKKLSKELDSGFPQFVIYLASADVYKHDPMNGRKGPLSVLEIAQRDELVFQMLKAANLPVAFCLGGGYHSMEQNEIIHTNTFKAALKVYSGMDVNYIGW